MPRIIVTTYESDHDLLPMVCAKCGRPAEDRVVRLLRYLDCDKQTFLAAGVVLGVLLFPPLFLWVAHRFSERYRVRVPMCETHRHDWNWRDRAQKWFVIPVWLVTVIALYGIALMYAFKGDSGNTAIALAGVPGVFFVLAVVENGIIAFGAVKVAKQPKEDGFRLSGVHEDFVATLTEDRARDRVDNPQRRFVLRADLQDDYDDEVH